MKVDVYASRDIMPFEELRYKPVGEFSHILADLRFPLRCHAPEVQREESTDLAISCLESDNDLHPTTKTTIENFARSVAANGASLASDGEQSTFAYETLVATFPITANR